MRFWSDLKSAGERLAQDVDRDAARIGAQLLRLFAGSSRGGAQLAVLWSFNDFVEDITKLAAKLRTEIDRRTRSAFAQELQRDAKVLDALLDFLRTIGGPAETADDPEDVDGEEDDEEEAPTPRGDREDAFEAYKRAARAQAWSALTRRRVGPRTRNGRILEWLGDRSLPESQRIPIGQMLQVQSALRPFVNPIRRYVVRIPARYRRFRSERQGEHRWYKAEGFEPNELNELELDVILLAMLRASRQLVSDRRLLGEINHPRFGILKAVRQLYRTQIVVDEATDFSPLQLGCMASLSDPAASSFVACGDFNQRITKWGTRSSHDLEWLFPDIGVRQINITYRHSRQLNELARQLASSSGFDAARAELPPGVNSDGVRPVLAKAKTGEDLITWVSARILEIERFTQKLPSIAVLVNDEADVQPTADRLGEALSQQNVRVVACPNGKVIGQETEVRVFDVQHIKGVEFEAVFFIDIDVLANRRPDLFDKFLYVGVTRAATYLGITCAGSSLPALIAPLEPLFGSAWS